MIRKFRSWMMTAALVAAAMPAAIEAGTFGRVVPIGGAASDIALDESRGVLYIANFTGNRVDVMSLADNTVQTSINVSAFPSSVALSPDGRYLVVAHYGNFATPGTPSNGLTVINLTDSSRQTFALGNPPFGVIFGADGKALVTTAGEFMLFDPASGTNVVLETIGSLTAKTLPVPAGNAPTQIVGGSFGSSSDGLLIYGTTEAKGSNSFLQIRYNVNTGSLDAVGWISTPINGPRAVSVAQDGSFWTSGWGLSDAQGNLYAQFPNPAGLLNVGSTAIDSVKGVIYAQIPDGTTTSAGQALPPPVLQIVDSQNLAVFERLQLPENLAGKSLLSSDRATMYSISDSGVMVLPVGSINQAPRVAALQEQIIFRGNFCNRAVSTQQLLVVNPGGGSVPFAVSTTQSGITLSPTSGVTPASITVSIDPNFFQNQKGTVSAPITIQSTAAVNIPKPVRVLINSREPDQRGTILDIPGTLIDLLNDPVRDRYYVLRQDTNQVLVFDGTSNNQIATLKTGNTPTQLAVTFDRQYLLIGADNSQFISVYDLDTLQPSAPIRMPGGHYPRSVASSGKAILAANRVAGPIHVIDRVDFASRTAVPLPTLGAFKNDIDINTMLVAAPNGSAIMAVEANGNVLLYDANADTFTVSRQDFKALSGAYAASSFNQYVVGSNLLNASLVPVRAFESTTGTTTGFSFVDQSGVRLTTAALSSPGIVQRVDLGAGSGIRATRMTEAPLLPVAGSAFTRTVAPLYSRNSIITLTVSGVTILPWNYDAAVAPPKLQRIVNAADQTQPVAPGGLVSVFGQDLSPVNLATREIPLPTALGDSCLTVNGVAVPMLFISPSQINAQLPFSVDGNTTLVLHTPGGVSDNFNVVIRPTAPSVFRTTVDGIDGSVASITRATNGSLVTLSNPVHRGDALSIYATGLGRTNPAVDAGLPGPANPLASAISKPSVKLGGVALPVVFAGLSPGQVGVYQINVEVPRWVPVGLSVPLEIVQPDGSTSLTVRVVE